MYWLNNENTSEREDGELSGKERSSLERKFHHAVGLGFLRKCTCAYEGEKVKKGTYSLEICIRNV
jgi:hypothetical protein